MTNASVLVRVFVLLVALGTCACASARAVATSSDEWIAYRKTRVSQTLEARIIASARYLARYPKGAFAPQLRQYYSVAELLYFEDLRQQPDGLYTYLVALPRGPHADEARQLLFRINEKSRGPTGFDAGVMAVSARIGEVAARRTAVREEILEMLRLWLDPEAFKRPLAKAPAKLIVPWSLSLPQPRCIHQDENAKNGVVRTCVKLLEEAYEAKSGEALEAREATVEVTVAQDASGRPRWMSLGGPDLFLRIEETFGGRTIAADDTSGRATAVSHVTEVVRQEFIERISDDVSCRKRPRSAAVLDLQCQGMRVRVEAGLDGASDDRIVVEPYVEPSPNTPD